MSDFFDEINMLVGDIINHNADSVQVKARIDGLKKQYGEDSFSSINFEKKPLPWDEAYLRELREKNVTGACSEEFLLHMAEVSDYLSARKGRTSSIVAGVAIVLVLILIIIFVSMFFRSSADAHYASTCLLYIFTSDNVFYCMYIL